MCKKLRNEFNIKYIHCPIDIVLLKCPKARYAVVIRRVVTSDLLNRSGLWLRISMKALASVA
jgi:hypothetical protein